MVDTLEYLKKGGRITPAAAALGTLLKLKPVLHFYLLRFPFGKFPLSFLTLIEGKNIGENAPRYDLNFPLWN